MVDKVYLIRHGHIDTGGEKRYIGKTDIPLSSLGKEQAQKLYEYFLTIPIETVFTSPLNRCVTTANIICESKNLKIHKIKALQEINMGVWENLPLSLIKNQSPQAFEQRGKDIEHFVPDEGESFGALSKRVLDAFYKIVTSYEGIILIVAHAGVNRVILRHFLNISYNNIFSIEQSYANVYTLECKENNQWLCKKIR